MSRPRKRFIYIYGFVLLLLITAYILSGLFSHKTNGGFTDIKLYFLDSVSNALKSEARTIDIPLSNAQLIKTALTELAYGPSSGGLYVTIPREVIITEARLNEQDLSCDVLLSNEYYELTAKERIFCAASLVYTLTELDFINDVSIYISNERLKSASGRVIGKMNKDNITLSPMLSPVVADTMTVTLYFAEADNASLSPETRTIEVSKNIEYHIIEQLIEGPQADGLNRTLLPDLTLKDVNAADGICYVDFGPEFLTRQLLAEDFGLLAVKSIVYSLTQRHDIQYVRIIADSAAINAYAGEIDLSMPISNDAFDEY